MSALLKEVAVAAGLGTIGKNALFFSRRFGFNCKLNVVFLNAAVDRYDPTPASNVRSAAIKVTTSDRTRDGWRLAARRGR